MQAQIKVWGNSQGLRIPKSIMDELKIKINDVLDIETEKGRIILTKHSTHKTLEQRYIEFEGNITPLSEFDWGESEGREFW